MTSSLIGSSLDLSDPTLAAISLFGQNPEEMATMLEARLLPSLRFTERFRIQRERVDLSWHEAISAMSSDGAFVALLTKQLQDSAFAAFFFETPPVCRHTIDHAFEVTLIDAPTLAGSSASADAFRRPFGMAPIDQPIIAFANLGGDSELIAPRPSADAGVATHLASFVRTAETKLVGELWRKVGLTIERSLDDRPLWLSTNGLAVPWLHIRLDRRPKYIQTPDYLTLADNEPS